MTTLPTPPRRIDHQTQTQLWLGRWLLLLSVVGVTLVNLGVVFLLVTYGIRPGPLLLSPGPTLEVESSISAVEARRLVGGGRGTVAQAQVRINDSLFTVEGYGPKAETAVVGDRVTIVVPKNSPDESRLKGFWQHPVSVPVVLKFAGGFYLVPISALLLSLWRSKRALKLLREGEEKTGSVVRKLPFPRPLKDYNVVQLSFRDVKGEKRKFWTVQSNSDDSHLLVVKGKKAALVSRLIPQMTRDGDLLMGINATRVWILRGAVFFIIGNLVLIGVYCLL